MATTQPASDRYVIGPSRARKHARLETRPCDGPHDSAGGYERIRTTERVESDPREGTIDVYFAHHRLLALAWDIDDCLPSADYEGVVDPSILDGMDVHHNAPELEGDRGVPWDNRECCLEVIDHGEHAALTNAERRAYARDQQKLRDGVETLPTDDGCVECGEEADARVSGDRYCLDHAVEVGQSTGDTVEML